MKPHVFIDFCMGVRYNFCAAVHLSVRRTGRRSAAQTVIHSKWTVKNNMLSDHISQFRHAEPTEAQAILDLYQSVIGTPFCTWNEFYPGMEEIEADLAAGNLFVLAEGDRLLGAVSVCPENELDGLTCWTSCENAGEFARVVIRPDAQGRGFSHLLVRNVLDEMRNRGLECVHISVAVRNIPAQKCYLHFGFREAGTANMWGNDYLLYELQLK